MFHYITNCIVVTIAAGAPPPGGMLSAAEESLRRGRIIQPEAGVSGMPALVIRELTTAAEIKPLQALQRDVWAMDDWLEVVPVHQLMTAALHGGIILGAYVDGALAGFSYGFIGLEAGEPMLCSHMLGVLPEYRRLKLGERLKWEQRRVALERGISLITWTYDPLETANGALNLGRLGAVCQTYSENLYGAMVDGLNAGLPSDRLTVQWHLLSRRVKARAAGAAAAAAPAATAHPLNAPQPRGDGLLAPGDNPAPPLSGTCQLVLPRHFQVIKQTDPALAMAWRLHVRQGLQQCFAAGWWLTGHAWTPDGSGAAYILTQVPPGAVPDEEASSDAG